jgi:pseudouridine-5'-phosphate glycosidase/pseudouridine kinase
LVAFEIARLEKDRIADHAYASFATYPSAAIGSSPFPGPTTSSSNFVKSPPITDPLPKPSVLVFGSAAIDITSTSPMTIEPRTTTPGANRLTPGGVGRNIAEAAQNLLPSGSVMLISPVGAEDNQPDALGIVLMSELERSGLRQDGLIRVERARTSSCSLVLEKGGDLVGGVADMSIVEVMAGDLVSEGSTSPDRLQVKREIEKLAPKMAVFDCNLIPEAIDAVLGTCLAQQIPSKHS